MPPLPQQSFTFWRKAIISILAREDPMRLLQMGAPPDEYETEADQILCAVLDGAPLTMDLLQLAFEDAPGITKSALQTTLSALQHLIASNDFRAFAAAQA